MIIVHPLPILSLDYSTSVEELFTNDKVAIIHQGNWIVPTLDSLDPEFSQEKLGILPLFVDQDDQGYISAGPSWFWGVNKEKDDEVVEASKDFIDWMYTSDYGKEQIVEEFLLRNLNISLPKRVMKRKVFKTLYQKKYMKCY